MFYDNLLFEMFKDKCLKSKERFTRTLGELGYKVDIGDLYRRIVNYQIQKFGCTLDADVVDNLNKEYYERKKYYEQYQGGRKR